MSKYCPKPYEPFGGDINVKVDLSNYATKKDIKNITHVDTSSFALKTNVAKVDKLDIDKLVPVSVDLSKLSDVVKNGVIKKAEYNKLANKVNNIDTSRFVLKTKHDADKLELEKKVSDTNNLIKKSDYNTKISEIENKTPSISNLATKTALTTVEIKIPSTNNLVKKTDYNAKITEIENEITNHKHDEHITTREFNKLATDAFNTRIAQANLVKKTDFDNKLSDLNRNITKNKSDHVLVKNELNKLKTFGFVCFIGKSHFEGDGVQNCLVFQPVHRYFKFIANTNFISKWISKGLSSESIKPLATSDNNLTPAINNYGTKTRVKFTGSCLQQSKISYTHRKIVNIYVVYELGASSSNINDPTLKNCLFGAVTLTKNTDIDKYGYPGCGTGFDRRSIFSFPGGGFGQNIIIFRVDMRSSVHIDNKKGYINFWKRTNARIRTYTNRRKNVFY